MAKDETGSRNSAEGLDAGLGLLERAWDSKWALRLVCVLLFFDAAMLLHVQRGISQWPNAGARLLEDVGWLATTAVIFSVLAAIVTPAMAGLLRQLSRIIANELPSIFSGDESIYQRPFGYVFAHDLRDLALDRKDEFLLRIYEEHEDARQSADRSYERFGDLVAAVLLCGVADWFIGNHIPDAVGLVGAILRWPEHRGEFAILVALCSAGLLLKWAWFPPYRPSLIYFPPLDRELRDKERAARGRKWENEAE